MFRAKPVHMNAYNGFIHNCKKLVSKQTVGWPYNGILHSNQKAWTTDHAYNMDESQMQSERRSQTEKLHIVWFYSCNILEKAHCGNKKPIGGFQRAKERFDYKVMKEFFGMMELFISWFWWWLHDCMYFLEPYNTKSKFWCM